MQRKIRRLSWQTVNNAMVRLLERAQRKGLLRDRAVIVGVPRGGLPLAIWLSHRTGIPFSPMNPLHGLPERGRGFIVVDDIVDSGNTASHASDVNPDAVFLAMITPGGEMFSKFGVSCSGAITHARDTWFVFPWEDPAKAASDLRAYNKQEAKRMQAENAAKETSLRFTNAEFAERKRAMRLREKAALKMARLAR